MARAPAPAAGASVVALGFQNSIVGAMGNFLEANDSATYPRLKLTYSGVIVEVVDCAVGWPAAGGDIAKATGCTKLLRLLAGDITFTSELLDTTWGVWPSMSSISFRYRLGSTWCPKLALKTNTRAGTSPCDSVQLAGDDGQLCFAASESGNPSQGLTTFTYSATPATKTFTDATCGGKPVVGWTITVPPNQELLIDTISYTANFPFPPPNPPSPDPAGPSRPPVPPSPPAPPAPASPPPAPPPRPPRPPPGAAAFPDSPAVRDMGFAPLAGDVQLVGSGKNDTEGIVQVYSSTAGGWVSVCDGHLTIYDAIVICRQLGFQPNDATGLYLNMTIGKYIVVRRYYGDPDKSGRTYGIATDAWWDTGAPPSRLGPITATLGCTGLEPSLQACPGWGWAQLPAGSCSNGRLDVANTTKGRPIAVSCDDVSMTRVKAPNFYNHPDQPNPSGGGGGGGGGASGARPSAWGLLAAVLLALAGALALR